MEEEEKKTEEQEPKAEEPQTEEAQEPAAEEPKAEDDGGAPVLPEIVMKLRADYEAQIKALKANYEKALSERDEIIRNLITGEDAGNSGEEESRVSQMISEARGEYKKW